MIRYTVFVAHQLPRSTRRLQNGMRLRKNHQRFEIDIRFVLEWIVVEFHDAVRAAPAVRQDIAAPV